MAPQQEPAAKIIYADSLTAEPSTSEVVDEASPLWRRLLLLVAVFFGLAVFAAGVIYWIEQRHLPVVVAISPPDGREKDPLGDQGGLVPVSPELLHVTSIALGNPALAIVNGKRLGVEDWLVIKTPNGEASLRVILIQDGLVRFKHGGNTIDAKLQLAQAKAASR